MSPSRWSASCPGLELTRPAISGRCGESGSGIGVCRYIVSMIGLNFCRCVCRVQARQSRSSPSVDYNVRPGGSFFVRVGGAWTTEMDGARVVRTALTTSGATAPYGVGGPCGQFPLRRRPDTRQPYPVGALALCQPRPTIRWADGPSTGCSNCSRRPTQAGGHDVPFVLNALAIASPRSLVLAVPPMSGVRGLYGSASTRSMAASTACAASA